MSGLLLAALLAAAASAAPAPPPDAAPRVLAVEPVRAGELLACHVRTAHLPGAKLASSMKSGLPSAIEMALDVLDPKDRVIVGNRITFRLAFDLWEETFRVEGPETQRDFTSQEELEAFLADLPRLPVAPLERLRDAAAKREALRVRVGVVLHPLAPRESERLGDWVAGESGEHGRAANDPTEMDDAADPRDPRDPSRITEPVGSEDGREVVVSLGQVIRYFFEGGRARQEVAAQGVSAPFTVAELREESAP